MSETPKTPAEYHLYEDTSLIGAVEQGDEHLGLLLSGLRLAEEIAERNSDRPELGNVVEAAEEGVRAWIDRQGYSTLEPEEDNPNPDT